MLRELRVCGEAAEMGTEGRFQGKGLGTRLLRAVEDDLVERRRALALVNSSVGARSFFLRNGDVTDSAGYVMKSLGREGGPTRPSRVRSGCNLPRPYEMEMLT